LSVLVHTVFSAYQQSRYHSGTPGYRPQWDGIRWVPESGKFTCLEFTGEMQNILKKFGIVSYFVYGTKKENKSLQHCWIGIPFGDTILHFEPQNLVFFDPNEEYENIVVSYKSYK